MWDLIVSVPDHCLSFYFGWKIADELMLSSSHVSVPIIMTGAMDSMRT